jgi:hypothetical protein
MQTALSIIALVMSALSLGWQAATFVLTGGRVKVELRIGAMHAGSWGMIHAPVDALEHTWSDVQAEQGYVDRVIVVLVRNVGRLPVSVMEWSVMAEPTGASFRPVGHSIGPDLPYRLDPGTTETWAVRLSEIVAPIEATKTAFRVPEGTMRLRGQVGLGNGKSVTTPTYLPG